MFRCLYLHLQIESSATTADTKNEKLGKINIRSFESGEKRHMQI